MRYLAIAALLVLSVMLRPSFGQAETQSWTEVERMTRQAEADLIAPWEAAWLARRPAALLKLLAPSAEISWDHSLALARDRGGITESRWESKPAAAGRPALAQFSDYLKPFVSMEAVELTVEDAEFSGAQGRFTVRFDARGRQAAGTWREDRGLLEVGVRRGAEGTLKIVSLRAGAAETLTAEKRGFEDVTAKTGLTAVSIRPRQEALRRGGYALAVGDTDGDGWPDVYVGGSGPGQLFRNVGGKSFREVTQRSGLGADTMVKAAVIADMDNDGRTDLVFQRFVVDGSPEMVFYKGLGEGRFAPAPAKLASVGRHDRPMSMAAADLNGDGKLDLYIGYPGTRDFTDSRGSLDPAVKRGAVYMNEGGWSFAEAENALPHLASPDRPHSEIVTDINEDGLQDLIVVNDDGGPSRLYVNEGKGTFRFAAEPEASLGRGLGMMAVAGDFGAVGRQGLYLTNIDLSAGHRLKKLLDRAGAPQESYKDLEPLLEGNRLYMPQGLGAGPMSFQEISAQAGVGWAGEAPAGAEWLDYDGDGWLDLYVANGLWSNDPKRDHASDFALEMASGKRAEAGKDNQTLRDLQASGKSFAGYQRNRLFRNNGDRTFTEVGYLVGVDRIEDGYVVAFSDIDRDGRLDLLLRNADPASLRRPYPVVTLLRNVGAAHKTVSIAPLGKDGSPAFGTRIVLRASGRDQVREVRSVQGAVQSEAAAFFGIGEAGKAEAVEVLWLSGRRDRFLDVVPGHYVLREGAGLVAAVKKAPQRTGGR